ncbi:2-(1,2-epoxy-1,2-dihydrophenyl)acetyl-CoA isomerase PaaG [Phenylobacterium sp.]|uniref:2-(1,2-epoxy-1,2-dihydrophenyl)acetyl-CoA isomerase PaaG n=1 Tax=Phenylobacterium sp. TaxID=1871053 RepID=UPI00289C9B06|nr:2-(1,2-epoxy-1,2-dihydrophenyl)acetyl-CoA isomerase PaaG [Phenylobacterium sp.]
MTYQTIIFSLEAGVARLTLNRPDRLNAFDSKMHEEVADALGVVERASDARVLLLAGAGRGFCAGQDLGERKRGPGDPPPDLGESIELRYAPLIRRLTNLELPVVCAVNGVAAGAGANIALACDLVIATQSSRFIQSFVNIGLVPDAGGTWLLPRLVGGARALGMAMTGAPVSAADAEALGLIWRCVPDAEFAAEVEALVAKLASAPTRALAASKLAIRSAWGNSLSAQLDLERDLQRSLGLSADYAEGVAAFGEKRPAKFRGN